MLGIIYRQDYAVLGGKHRHRQHLFVGGPHHSGTTLLAKLLCSTRPLRFSCLQQTGVSEDEGQHLQHVYNASLRHGGMCRFALDPKSYLSAQHVTSAARTRRLLMQSWGPHWNLEVPILVEKTPGNLIHSRWLQQVFEVFPTRFVFTLRHPYGCTAVENGSSNKEGLVDCGHDVYLENWLRMVRILEADLPHLRHAWLVRFETWLSSESSAKQVFEQLLLRLSLYEQPPAGRLLGLWDSGDRGRTGTGDIHIHPHVSIWTPELPTHPYVPRFEARLNRYGYSLLSHAVGALPDLMQMRLVG